MNLQEAIEFPRAFMLNNKLKIEKKFFQHTYEALKKIGHNVSYENDLIGGAQGIIIDRF